MNNYANYDLTDEQWKRIQPLLLPEYTGKKRRTKGGLNTKIHAIANRLGNPVAFLLPPGNQNDSTHVIELMRMIDITGSNLLGDKAYGTKGILAYIKEHKATAVIPPRVIRKNRGR